MENVIIKKECKYHNFTDFKLNTQTNKSYCMQCARDKTNYSRWAQKIKAINYLGGKCIKCQNKFENISIYDFHHKENKIIEISQLIAKNKKFESFIDELNKCELLCANCHCELHDEEIKYIEMKTYNSHYMVQKRIEQKNKIIQLLGGKCCKCNYDKSNRALHPHHLENKNFGIGGNGSYKTWDLILNEIKKCELLCSNCHRIKHSKFKNVNYEFLQKYLK